MARGSTAKTLPKNRPPSNLEGAKVHVDAGFPPAPANGQKPSVVNVEAPPSRPNLAAVLTGMIGPCPQLPEDGIDVMRVKFRPGESVSIHAIPKRMIGPKDGYKMKLDGPMLWIESTQEIGGGKFRRYVTAVPMTNLQSIDFPVEEGFRRK